MEMVVMVHRIGAWCEKGSGTFVRSTLRAVPAKVPDPFSHQAGVSGLNIKLLLNLHSLTVAPR